MKIETRKETQIQEEKRNQKIVKYFGKNEKKIKKKENGCF